MSTITSRVSPLRVRSLLLSALDLFSKGDKDGRFWIQGDLKTQTPIVGNRYGYCSIGAINEVPGFSEAEKQAARVALAKIIDREYYSGDYLESHEDYDEETGLYKVPSFEEKPYLADDLIAEVNDDDYTEFSNIRSWFTSAADFLKRKS